MEEEEEPRHGLPRRQSIGGVSVRDLAAKHEKNNHFTKDASSTRKPSQIGRVKPVLMQEISYATIQEDQEFQSEERASEVMKAAVIAGEEKQKIVEDVMGRESFVQLMDSMCDELMNMDDLELEAIANESVHEPASIPAPKSIPTPAPSSVPAPKSAPIPVPAPQSSPIPVSAPQSSPIPIPKEASTPTPVSKEASIPTPPTTTPAFDEEDLGLADLTEDLDFDAIVAEMSRDIATTESRKEEARRSSIESTGFSLANFSILSLFFSLLEFTPRKDTSDLHTVEKVFTSHCSVSEGISSFEVMGILHELCDGVITPKDMNM